jgi:hypothetical protein
VIVSSLLWRAAVFFHSFEAVPQSGSPSRPLPYLKDAEAGQADFVPLLEMLRGQRHQIAQHARLLLCRSWLSAKTSTAGPSLDLLNQMKALTITVELNWSDDIRADAQRCLIRIARALRHAPETRERSDV